MIKKLGLFFLFIFLFFIINFYNIKSYYYNYFGHKFYIQNDLDKSSSYFLKANNDSGNYNLGNISYLKGDYNSAINYFSKVNEYSFKELFYRTNHNIGNSYYRLGEKNKENELNNYKNSLIYYEKALNIKFDKETKSNYDFVLDKINKLENNKEKEKDKNNNENKDGNENNSDKNQQKDNKSMDKENKSQKSDNLDVDKQNNLSQDQNLNDEQLKAIEEYKEMLKKEQDLNSEGFNKIYEGENIDIFESFFDNSLLEENNKKDW